MTQEGRVPVEPLQRALELSSLTAAQVAGNMGWRNNYRSADVTRLRRTLGLTKKGPGKWRKTVDCDLAARLLRAMHVDPVDVDL